MPNLWVVACLSGLKAKRLNRALLQSTPPASRSPTFHRDGAASLARIVDPPPIPNALATPVPSLASGSALLIIGRSIPVRAAINRHSHGQRPSGGPRWWFGLPGWRGRRRRGLRPWRRWRGGSPCPSGSWAARRPRGRPAGGRWVPPVGPPAASPRPPPPHRSVPRRS